MQRGNAWWRESYQGFLLLFLTLSEWWIYLRRIWEKSKKRRCVCLVMYMSIAEAITALLVAGMFWQADAIGRTLEETGYVRLAVIMLILVIKEKRYRRWFGTLPFIAAVFQILLAGSYL